MQPQPGCKGVGHILEMVQCQGEGVHHILQEGVVHNQVERVGVGVVPQLVEEALEIVQSSHVVLLQPDAWQVSFGTQTRSKYSQQ